MIRILIVLSLFLTSCRDDIVMPRGTAVRTIADAYCAATKRCGLAIPHTDCVDDFLNEVCRNEDCAARLRLPRAPWERCLDATADMSGPEVVARQMPSVCT